MIASVLAEFRKAGWGGRSVVLWFVAANGWLDTARPVDLLDIEPDKVVQTARYRTDTW